MCATVHMKKFIIEKFSLLGEFIIGGSTAMILEDSIS